jgi:predicted TIM-barrel fold metal-dependent hydrolase
MYQDLHVIDFHSHFPSSEHGGGQRWRKRLQALPDKRRRAILEAGRPPNDQWRLAWDFPRRETASPPDEEQAQRWAEEVTTHGLDRVCFVTGGGNDHLAEIVQLHPDKFIGFAHHEPFADGAAEELERAVEELGLRGYKVLAPTLDRPIADEAAHEVWEVCADHQIPVLIHFGILGAGGGIAYHPNINPIVLHDAAKMFPDVTFVVPHLGCGFITDTLMLCWACPNVYVDTSGSNQWMRWVQGDVTIRSLLRKYLETIGPDRILFGSDSSWFPRGFALRYLQDQVRELRFMNVGQDVLQKVFASNAARLLKIDA